MDPMDWIDGFEEKQKEERSKEYFNIVEGDNRFQLLTHCAPQPLVWTGTKYEPAEEGAKNVSIKGVAWVLQDGMIKLAKLPYSVVKAIRAFQNDQETLFETFPMPYPLNVKAKNAGSKEVEYTVIPSRSNVPISQDILDELAKKPTPEEMVEKMKAKKSLAAKPSYPQGPNPEEIPF